MMENRDLIRLIYNSIGIMTPFLLAATGGLFTELAGILNIALEGLILIGAFFSVIFKHIFSIVINNIKFLKFLYNYIFSFKFTIKFIIITIIPYFIKDNFTI